MTGGTSLFRREAVEHRADRLHGSVNLATPVAWQLIGFLLLAALAASFLFFARSSYARVETVEGSVALDRGVASILSSRQGVVSRILVREGQRVESGTPLLQVRSEESMIGGATAPERMRAAIEAEDRGLASQGLMVLNAASADEERMRTQISGLLAESGSIERQIEDQRRLVDAAERDFGEVQGVAAKGFISRRDLEAREAALLSRRQQLAQLEQSLASKRSDASSLRRSIDQAAATARAQVAASQSSRAALLQRAAEAELARGYVITSPVDGVVTALTARLGASVTADQTQMLIVPDRSRPRAELFVPTAAAGFLSPGQEVRLAVDAFPYQRFGTVPAKITSIAGATTTKQGANGQTPGYLVDADLVSPAVTAYGRRQPLLPGMTLSARIVTERRSLLEWLFEPLFAVTRR